MNPKRIETIGKVTACAGGLIMLVAFVWRCGRGKLVTSKRQAVHSH